VLHWRSTLAILQLPSDATAVVVNCYSICRKIDEAVDAGEDPYELKVDRKRVRRAKPVKKAKSKKERTSRK